ncbi:unnamed protein product [Arctogadus glacialis]
MGWIPGCCHVWFVHQKEAHNPLLSIFPDVWEGSRYPSQVQENYEVDGSFEEQFNEEKVAMDIEQQDKIVNIVKQNVDKVQERTRGRMQSLQKRKCFKVGDMVRRKNVRSLQWKGGKLNPEFLGPFTVVNIEEKSVDLVDSSLHLPPPLHLPTPLYLPAQLHLPPPLQRNMLQRLGTAKMFMFCCSESVLTSCFIGGQLRVRNSRVR